MASIIESMEDNFVHSVACLIDVQCSIEHNEKHIYNFGVPDSDDMNHLYENRDILMRNARNHLASIPDVEKPYAIGRGRQMVYDCERAVTNYRDLCELLKLPR